MKVKTEEPKFQPVKIEITVESADELRVLAKLAYLVDAQLPTLASALAELVVERKLTTNGLKVTAYPVVPGVPFAIDAVTVSK